MLQSTFLDLVVGLDFHQVLLPTPGGSAPAQLPLPFVGLVWDPAGLAVGSLISMALGGGPGLVLVNGLPVTNGGTAVTNLLTLPHMPAPGVAFVKGAPGNDAELVFGSHNVSLGGSLGVRLGDIALSCGDPVRLPTSVVLALPKGPPVYNNAAMVPDVEGVAQRLALLGGMKALRGAARGGARLFRMLRRVQRRSQGWARASGALRRAVERIAPQRYRDRLKRAVCFVTGHPVDVATGRVFTSQVDFELPGPLPLSFERVYSSSLSWRPGPVGAGWSHSLHQEVWEEPGKVVYLAEDGRELEFLTGDLPGKKLRPGESLYEPTNGLTLRALGNGGWEIEAEDGRVHHFAPVAGARPDRAQLSWIQSRDGHHRITLSYEERGLLARVEDSAGRKLYFAHDVRGRLSEVKLPLSREAGRYRHVRYRYSEEDDLVEVVDALGHSWRYEYQGHLLVKETDRTGLSFYFQYDGQGAGARCVRTWGDGGIFHHELSYDVRNRRTLVQDSLRHATLYQMDELGLVVKVTDPHGARTTYEYDEHCGKPTLETDPLGRTRSTVYDKRGNVVVLQEPDGATLRLEYNDRDLPVRMRDALGGLWTWVYDEQGHLLSAMTPTGERYAWGWRHGLVVWMETPGERRTSLEYDSEKNVRRVRAPNGALTEYEYDFQGRVVRVKNPLGAIVRYRHDALGRMVSVESPTGGVQEMAYDAEGNLLEVRSATRQVRFKYGYFHKVVEREEGGTCLRFLYDTECRLTGVINEAGEKYTYKLDACGRVSQETGFDGRKYYYVRDLAGQVTKRYQPSGKMSELGYDLAGRVVKIAHSDGTGAEFEYRLDGALVRAKNESAEVFFERDEVGRVVRERQGDFNVSSRYGEGGEREWVESSLGARMGVRWDKLGGVEALYLGAAARDARTPTISLERDALGMEVARELPGGVRVEWRRDLAARPLQRRTLRAGAGGMQEVEARTYHWRGEDQIAAIVDTALGATHYQHDARGRLVSQQRGEHVLHRAMDAVGNIYRSPRLDDRRYGPGGRLQEAEGVRYIQDEDGNQVTKVERDGGVWNFQWNGAGLLAEVERPDGLRVGFEYDAFARRTRKVLKRQGQDGQVHVESETLFTWDGNHLLHEVAGGREVITWYWEPGTFSPVAKETGGRRCTIATDHLGTPVEMYDELGQLAWRMQLDAFGIGRADVVLQHCPWRWPGQYRDEETALHYNRFRYLDLSMDKYISQDPVGIAGGMHILGYVNDPLTMCDPLGLIPVIPPGTPIPSGVFQISSGRWWIGSYSDLESLTSATINAHHVVQNAAVRDLPGYTRASGFAILLDGPSTTIGTEHYLATRKQDVKGGGTYAFERRVAYRALRAAGLTPDEAREVVQHADVRFAKIGVTGSTPTRVPGNRC